MILRYFGGFEMVAAIGSMLRAAELQLVIMVDGFIMTACALGAVRLYPAVKDYMVFAHCGDESGHRRMLQLLDAHPLLSLGLRLGEGTGALCAFPILDSAVRMVNEMNNFQNARITKYF
jgi:nicotinate-nucleotide--dimethylbenzimidazole phosphoribosyltransferase